MTTKVEVLAEVGDWFKVRWHKRAKGNDKESEMSTNSESKNETERNSEIVDGKGRHQQQQQPAGSGSVVDNTDTGASGTNGMDTRESLAEEKHDGSCDGDEDGGEQGYGWCLCRDGKHQYIVLVSVGEVGSYKHNRPSSAFTSRRTSVKGRRRSSVMASQHPSGFGTGDDDVEEEEEGECWHELKDEDGSVYYFNTASGVSQWEPPLWLDEVDPTSGAVYYVNSSSGEPQWERPTEFVPIVREDPYVTTPEQEFIKSVLSPKRSQGAKSFHESMSATMKAARQRSEQRLNPVAESTTKVPSRSSPVAPTCSAANADTEKETKLGRDATSTGIGA